MIYMCIGVFKFSMESVEDHSSYQRGVMWILLGRIKDRLPLCPSAAVYI